MDEKLITIAQFSDYIQADLAKQTLEDAGIRAVVTGANASNVYGGVSAIEEPALQVLESQADEAKQILDEMNEQQDEEQEDEQ